MEGDRVDGVDIANVTLSGRSLTVALEREVRGRVFLLDVLDSATTLDGANSETRSISEAADYPRLPLQRGLHGLVEFGRLVEIDDVDVAVCGTDD
jgi:hypothetical protein